MPCGSYTLMASVSALIFEPVYRLFISYLVHRDVKDENVVLGSDGKCILIDFGSSGLVKKSGWDTFSGT